MANKYPTLVSYHSLYGLFCDADLLPNATIDDLAAIPCQSTVPGTSLSANQDNSHMNFRGSLYAWPFVCDALEDAGVM